MTVLGAPGTGKGTYAKRLSPIFKIPHISTGDAMREIVASGAPLGQEIGKNQAVGVPVPDRIANEVIKERLSKSDCSNGFIFDTPYNAEQAKLLDNNPSMRIELALNFILPDSVLVQKMSARRLCENCGAFYNLAEINTGKIKMPSMLPKRPGICDKCGGKLIQRKDDAEAIIRERLEVYKKREGPLLDYYRKRGVLRNIEVIGSPDEMVPIILAAIEDFKKSAKAKLR